MASMAYSEQVGTKRHEGGVIERPAADAPAVPRRAGAYRGSQQQPAAVSGDRQTVRFVQKPDVYREMSEFRASLFSARTAGRGGAVS